MRLLLFCLFLGPALATSTAHAEDVPFSFGALTAPLSRAELTAPSSGPNHREVRDAATGWTWRIEQVGDGQMQFYPEPGAVRDTVAQRDGLLEPTELTIVPMAGGLGSLFGARTKTESVRTCFVGRAGSLWLLTMRSPRSVIEQSEPALRRACKDATFAGLADVSPATEVGLRLDPRVPVDWMKSDPPGPRSRSASFHQSSTGLTGVVIQQPRDGHPYDTDDLVELQRAVTKDGFVVRASELMRAAGQDAPRLEVGRPTGVPGVETEWLLVVLRGERSIWLVQGPVRSLGYPKLKQMFDLALNKAQLIDD